jgi:hypothetical protein
MSNLKDRLKQKGWSEEDIYKAITIIESGKTKKSKKLLFLDSLVYWLVLIVALIGNFVISIILIPFMLVIEGFRLFSIIVIIAFVFGAFFDLLIRDIENIQNKDVIIAGLFLPLLALINVGFMVEFANYLQENLVLGGIHHNPIIISIVYVIAFVLPYGIRTYIISKQGSENFVQRL